MLLLPVLWVMRRIAADRAFMGEHVLSAAGRAGTGAVLVALAACTGALAWLSP